MKILSNIVGRALDRVEAALYRRRYARHRATWPLFVGVVVLALVLPACGSVEKHARTALDATAHAVVAADAVVAGVYDRRSDEARSAALAAHPGLDEDDAVRSDYRARMERLDATVVALRGSSTALLDAQTILDAQGAESVLPMLGCVSLALGHLTETMRAAGLDPPPKLARAIGAIASLAGATCATTAEGAASVATTTETGGAP